MYLYPRVSQQMFLLCFYSFLPVSVSSASSVAETFAVSQSCGSFCDYETKKERAQRTCRSQPFLKPTFSLLKVRCPCCMLRHESERSSFLHMGIDANIFVCFPQVIEVLKILCYRSLAKVGNVGCGCLIPLSLAHNKIMIDRRQIDYDILGMYALQ